MRELARLAGVSQSTVSLALRNHPRISAATKARVARLVRKHRYVVDGRVTELMRSIRKHSASELTGCPFAERCGARMPGQCEVHKPASVEIVPGHRVACFLHSPLIAGAGVPGTPTPNGGPHVLASD